MKRRKETRVEIVQRIFQTYAYLKRYPLELRSH